jgi:exosortase
MNNSVVAVVDSPETAASNSHVWRWQLPVVVLLTGILYNDVIVRLLRDWWTDSNYSHGLLIPFFSGFVVWRKRQLLAALPVKPCWIGAVIVAGSLAMLIVGALGAELFLSRASLVFLLAGGIILFFGWTHFCAVFFAWACLFLMIPLPAIIFNQITLPLQLLASRLAAWSLAIIGIPVLRRGNIIELATMQLEVADACSGIRSLISLGTVAVIYGYLAQEKVWRRAALFIFAVPIAVLANGARITFTGAVAQYWNPDIAKGVFHEFSGWVIFLLSIAMLLLVHRGLRMMHGWQNRRTE